MDKQKQDFFKSYAAHSIILALAVNLIYQALRKTKVEPDTIAGIGILLWAFISFIIVKEFLIV